MRQVIELAEEIDGFKVFAASELIGDPLAFLARIIEVEHRRHGIHTQAV